MSRGAALSQSKRNLNNPLVLGTFSSTSLRYLKGHLGPENKVIGRADTSTTSNGGFGGGAYNHWYQINLTAPAWIILTKGPPRPKYINISAYDLNRMPIAGLSIFQADSVTDGRNINGDVYFPYLDAVMGSQSDLYNTYSRFRLDRGDERYYPLGAGSYLICISTTRNEPLDYEVGLVIEFPPTEMYIILEDEDYPSLILQETQIDFARTIDVPQVVTTDTVISASTIQPNGFTKDTCTIINGVTVTVLQTSSWLIGPEVPNTAGQTPAYGIFAEPADDEYYNTIHDHSLSEWRDSWIREHQDTDRFPDLFIPLTNRV